MRESELRALIVRDEAKFNIGIMHKRSLLGILEGLKSLQIISEEDGFYFPAWVDEERRTKRKEPALPQKKERDEYETPLRKKNHIDRNDRASK